MKEYKVPVQSLIDHIKTAMDVDPWAAEMAEELLKNVEYKDKMFRALENDWNKLRDETRWIPVSERLPKSMANKVIVYLQHEDLAPYIGYGHYEKYQGEEMWYDLENDEQFSKRGYTVTHWMPMPKSPDGEKLTLD